MVGRGHHVDDQQLQQQRPEKHGRHHARHPTSIVSRPTDAHAATRAFWLPPAAAVWAYYKVFTRHADDYDTGLVQWRI